MAVRETTNDTPQQRDRQLDLTLPDDLPAPNSVTFALFHGRNGDALELIQRDHTIYLLSFGPRNRVAALSQSHGSFAVRPTSYGGRELEQLLDGQRGRAVALQDTPLWVAEQFDDNVQLSWHARERFGERVRPMVDCGRAVRRALDDGHSVDVRENQGVYHAASDTVVVYTLDEGRKVVLTVGRLDDFDEVDG